MKEIFTALSGNGLSGLLWLLARSPEVVRRGFTEIAAFFFVHRARQSRRTISANLEHIKEGLAASGVQIGSVDSFADQNLRFTAGLLAETAICWRGSRDQWRSLIGEIHGKEAVEVLQAAVSRQATYRANSKAERPDYADRGVLLLSPHLGNWELLNMYLGAEFRLTVLYDPPKIKALESLVRNARERTQSTVLPIGAAGLRGMVQRLRSGGVVGLLPDQVPDSNNGVAASFFGKQALTINLVHRLVQRNQPRVFLVCALRNAQDRYDIHFDELTEVLGGASELDSANAMNLAIERRIVQAPEQYQWSYKRFKRAMPDALNIYPRGSA